jgi:hypothetical protein
MKYDRWTTAQSDRIKSKCLRIEMDFFVTNAGEGVQLTIRFNSHEK